MKIVLALSLGGLEAFAEAFATGDISPTQVAAAETSCQEFGFLIDQPDVGLVSKHLDDALKSCAQNQSQCEAEVRILKEKHADLANKLSAQCGQKVAMLKCYPAQAGQPGNGSQGGAGGRGGYCVDDGQSGGGGYTVPAQSDDDDDNAPVPAYPSARAGTNGRNGASIDGGIGGQGGAAGQGPYGGAGGNGGAGVGGGVGGRGGAGGRSY